MMLKHIPLKSLFVILFSFPVISFSQQTASSSITVKKERVVPDNDLLSWQERINSSISQPKQLLLQFDHLLSTKEIKQLNNSGILILDYITERVYTCYFSSSRSSADFSKLGVKSIIDPNERWKLDDGVILQMAKPSKDLELLVSFLPGTIEYSEIENLVEYNGGKIVNKKYQHLNTYIIKTPKTSIFQLAREPRVRFIAIPPVIVPLNQDAAASTGATFAQSPVATGGYGLDGSAITVGVGDNSTGTVHIDVRDRTINFDPWPASMHGVHTTLTVAGKGIMDPRTRGMAPGSRILSHLFDIVVAETGPMYTGYNMTLTNNSYAADNFVGNCDSLGDYNYLSVILDDQMNTYKEVLHVFASGNEGLGTCAPYPQGHHTLAGGYQPAKNVLTVGGMTKENQLWPKSSRGPASDGRLKPEIMGYAFSMFSGDVFDNYGYSNGTSMSCPHVTGCLALLQQRYRQLHSNQNIPSNLLKAVAMNGAVDFGNPGPDYTYGYGLVNDYRSLQILDNNRYMIDSVTNGPTKTFNINVPANTAQLKVMLYWHDATGSLLASKALVNNLDLQVKEPNNTLHNPLVLDPTPANVSTQAVEGLDTLNNSEQVVINSPAAGSYTVTVKGTTVATGTQPFVVAYDFIPVGIKIKYPVAGIAVPSNDTVRIYWDASNDAAPFTLEYYDGLGWNTIVSNLAATERQYVWHIPSLTTTQGRVRITRGSQTDMTGLFPMSPQPVVTLAPTASQCPGYMAFSWTAVPGVTGYQILKKIGDDLRVVDTVPSNITNYILKGLKLDSFYYAGVAPLINGVQGYRSKSVKRLPSDGSCSGSISDGDLMLQAVVFPGNGRIQTSSQLSSNETLTVRIRNLDDVAANNYKVSYNINGGAWQSQAVTGSISPNSNLLVNFTGLNLSALGVYQLKVAVTNQAITDAVTSNDTLIKFVKQVPNDTINLVNAFSDDFENLPFITTVTDSFSFSPNGHWDFMNTNDTGRFRTFVASDVLISGQRSLTMDRFINTTTFPSSPDVQNYLIGTFNLGGYDKATTEARIEFDYKLHGKPKYLSGNQVWIRPNDNSTTAWLPIFSFDTVAFGIGQIKKTGSLSITNALLSTTQNFTTSFQVRIGQHDTAVVAMNEYGNGLTIDNFRIYGVNNDMQLLSILTPKKQSCGLGDEEALSVLVYNSDNLPQSNIDMYFLLDNDTVIHEVLPYIAAKDTIQYTFTHLLKLSQPGNHILDVWLSANGDTYLANDSILNYKFRNQPLITEFPYLQNFEGSDGFWFAEGTNSSWEYGTPSSPTMNKAASGSKAWATSLSGNYNNDEHSYLYSPCFDISGLSVPMLSFSISNVIENCGGSSICDQGYIEYSTDGNTWTKLGAVNQGYNWYGTQGVWNDSNSRWRVASIPLPEGSPSLKLRFVINSDGGVAKDGFGVDDIHIFDMEYPVYDGSTVKTTKTVTGPNWIYFTSNNKLLAQINPLGKNLGSTDVDMFLHNYVLHPFSNQYNLVKNFVINSTQAPSGSDTILVRFYITDEDVLKLVTDNSCITCTKAEDAYRLGITKYDDADKSKENGSFADNLAGQYSYIPFSKVHWVPFDKGYYGETKLTSFSEFWFNTGIPTVKFSGSVIYPNPVTNHNMQIFWSAAPGTELTVGMYDAIGKLIYQGSAKSTDFDTKSVFTLPDLAMGMYTVKYSIGDEKKVVKLLVTQ
jgi:hypothetical protein